MKRRQLKGVTPFSLLFFALALCFFSACGAPQKPKEIAYIQEKDIPKTIAVMPARLLPGTKDETGFQIKPGKRRRSLC